MPELSASLTVSTPHATSISSLTDREQMAVPVEFEKLVAGVEAFDKTLPIITALRESRIAKLPEELIEMIEEFVLAPERETRLDVWSKLKRCWEGKCVLEDDHPIPADHEGCECRGCAREKCKREAIHRQNVYKFEDEFSSYGPLYERESLLARQLSVGIWVAQTSFDDNKWAVLEYLTLPLHYGMREGWKSRDSPFTLGSESGFGVPVHLSATPSPASLTEVFGKAMKRLGLKTFVHSAQKHTQALSAARDEEEVSEGEEGVSNAVTWPQLTLLMQSAPDLEPEEQNSS
jgi:hypothetical protein